MRTSREGGALPLVLLLLLALTGLAVGVLHLAISELQTVTAARHAWRATLAAKGGLVRGFVVLDSLLRQDHRPEGGTFFGAETPEGLLVSSRLQWLGPEFFLLEGIGGSHGWPGERRAGWVGWSLDSPSRIGAFRGAVEVGGSVHLDGTGSISVLPLDSIPDPWSADECSRDWVVLDSLFRGRTLPAWVPLTPEDLGEDTESRIPKLGLLTGEVLLSWVEEPSSNGEGRGIGPGVEPGCSESQRGALVGVHGSLTLREGALCGLVVVGGDLTLRDGARVGGLALVGGNLLVEKDSRLEGMARIRGSVNLADGAQVLGSPCLALWALGRLPGLRRPYRIPDGYQIRGF